MGDNNTEFRFNSRELIGIFVMLVVVSSMIFGLGVFVGKGMSETKALLFLKQQLKGKPLAQIPAVQPIKSYDPTSALESKDQPEFPIFEETYEFHTEVAPIQPEPKVMAEEREEISENKIDLDKYPRKSEMAKIFRDDAPTFSILLSTSPQKRKAVSLIQKLTGRVDGLYLDVVNKSELDSEPRYRVLVGKFHSRSQARNVAASLQVSKLIGSYDIAKLSK